jgi:GntR family transcriptional regulator
VASRDFTDGAAAPTPIRRPRADQARLVADVLRHQIHAGGYPDGLPSEADLAGEFFVSRNTVREALATLKDEGLIDRGPRTGTHVAIRKYDHGLDALVGLKETFKGYGDIRNEVRAAMAVAAPPSVANRLGLRPGERVVFVERLRYLGDLPLSLDMTYLAPDIGDEVLEHSLEVNDVFALIERVTGRRLGAADLAVEAVSADARIEGCTLCVEICPLDSLAINPENGKAFMHVDECWYCGPCAARCPTGAVTVNMPYLLR